MAEGVKWELELYFFSLGNGIWLAWSANHIPKMGLGFGKKIWGQEKGFITPPPYVLASWLVCMTPDHMVQVQVLAGDIVSYSL